MSAFKELKEEIILNIESNVPMHWSVEDSCNLLILLGNKIEYRKRCYLIISITYNFLVLVILQTLDCPAMQWIASFEEGRIINLLKEIAEEHSYTRTFISINRKKSSFKVRL